MSHQHLRSYKDVASVKVSNERLEKLRFKLNKAISTHIHPICIYAFVVYIHIYISYQFPKILLFRLLMSEAFHIDNYP